MIKNWLRHMIKNWLRDFIYKYNIRPKQLKLGRILPGASIYPTGSRYVCSPPVLNRDIDFIVCLEDDNWNDLGIKMLKAKYFRKTNYEGEGFQVWHKGNIDLIVFRNKNRELMDRHRVATHICREANIRRKDVRVVLHQIIRDKFQFKEVFLYKELGMPTNLVTLAMGLAGPHGFALLKAYMVQHDL